MRDQMERLIEISPAIPEFIIEKYKKEFKDIKDVSHPDVIKGLQKVIINRDELNEVVEENSKNIVVRAASAVPVKVTLK